VVLVVFNGFGVGAWIVIAPGTLPTLTTVLAVLPGPMRFVHWTVSVFAPVWTVTLCVVVAPAFCVTEEPVVVFFTAQLVLAGIVVRLSTVYCRLTVVPVWKDGFGVGAVMTAPGVVPKLVEALPDPAPKLFVQVTWMLLMPGATTTELVVVLDETWLLAVVKFLTRQPPDGITDPPSTV
jgi:hypothetical protein